MAQALREKAPGVGVVRALLPELPLPRRGVFD